MSDQVGRSTWRTANRGRRPWWPRRSPHLGQRSCVLFFTTLLHDHAHVHEPHEWDGPLKSTVVPSDHFQTGYIREELRRPAARNHSVSRMGMSHVPSVEPRAGNVPAMGLWSSVTHRQGATSDAQHPRAWSAMRYDTAGSHCIMMIHTQGAGACASGETHGVTWALFCAPRDAHKSTNIRRNIHAAISSLRRHRRRRRPAR
jgi:hypothetical protein